MKPFFKMHSSRKRGHVFYSKRSKKGLSDIVANLLVILLVLVAVGIVWAVVRNVIDRGAEDIELGQFTYDLNIESAYVSGTNIVVTVKRIDTGGTALVGVNFIFANATDSTR